MTSFKKFLGVFLIIILGVAGLGYGYVSDVAQGNLENWDPESYVQVESNGASFAVNTRGNKVDTPVILLHGFPETAVMWDGLMDQLAQQNFYAIAPNQRGYSSGARSLKLETYEIDNLVQDVLGIADQLGIKRFHLIGHDWGAAVGWQMAADYPDRVISYAALSVPHVDAFGKAYREDPAQYEATDYMRFFQKQLLPEFALAKSDYKALRGIWDQHDASEVERYLNILGQTDALTGALNWYRANLPFFENEANAGVVTVPTTFIWGNQDEALKRSGAEATKEYVSGEYEFIEMGTGHWIIQENYSETASHLLRHLAKYRSLN